MGRSGPSRFRLAARVAGGTLVTALAAALATVSACSSPPPFDSRGLDSGRLGAVRVRLPRGQARAFVLLFSDVAGWGAPEEYVTASLVRRGVLVVGVDLPTYRRGLDGDDGDCLYLLSEVESLSQQVQRRAGLLSYLTPIVAGSGEAGTLARAMLAQSPAATLAGAVAVDPTDVLHTRLPLCAGAASERRGDGFAYAGLPELPGFLTMAFTSAAEPAGRERVRESLRQGAAGEIANDGFGEATAAPAAELVEELVADHLRTSATVAEEIPGWLVETPASGASRTIAVVVSGDGGWRDLDKTIAGVLHDRGVSVIGWDSLRYFWDAKTPARFAADLDDRLRRRLRDWDADDVVLVGYSFGADALPFAYNLLPDDTRGRVRQLSLLALSDRADFEFHVSGWLGGQSSGARPTAPELAKLPTSKVQCFYGEEDEDGSLCAGLEARGVEAVRTAGSHHFDGDYEALAARILEGLARRRDGLAPPRAGAPSR